MKMRLLALVLTVALVLSGCTAMLERNYSSSDPHVDYPITEDSSILRVESYQTLVNSILYLVNEHVGGGTVRLYNYTGNVAADLERARTEVMTQDPLSAYALSDITYESTRILTYYEVEFRLSYRRSADQVAAIEDATGVSGLQQVLAQMVTGQQQERTLLVSYFSGDADQVEDLLLSALYNEPALYHDPGGTFRCEVSVYPETGTRRIVEIRVPNWGTTDEEELEDYTHQLEETATVLLRNNPPAGPSYTVEELVSIIRSVSGPYDPHGTHLPLGVLSGEAAYDVGLLLTMEYLCHRVGIEAVMVTGAALPWLIVETANGYRHLLPRSLHPAQYIDETGTPVTDPTENPLALYTDEELLALGYYQWDRSLYPACMTPADTTE